MKLLSKVLFYALIFLITTLHLNPIKAEQISNEYEKNNILQENQEKSENSFQKFFQEKSLKKDEVFKRKEERNFIEVSKETEKKEKPIREDERDENNPRKLTDEDGYIIVHYGNDASYPNGYRKGDSATKISKIIYKGDIYQDTDLYIEAGTYIEIYISSSVTELNDFFLSMGIPDYETNCENIIAIDLSHLKTAPTTMDHFFDGCNNFRALDMSGIDLSTVSSSDYIFNGVLTYNTLIFMVLH